MSYTHVVNGDHAAAILRTALAGAQRAEPVVAARDDLAIGPLRAIDDDISLRAAFWQQACDDPSRDVATELQGETATLQQLAGGTADVVMWHGQSSGDQLALRRVAYHLRNTPQRLNEINLTQAELDTSQSRPDGAAAVAMYSPAALQARARTIAPISILRIGRLALEWQELKQLSSDLRRWRDNTFQSGNFSELDTLILNHAKPDWQPLEQLAGQVMLANAGFFATDTLVFWRCRELAAAGRLALRAMPDKPRGQKPGQRPSLEARLAPAASAG
jgi:hypothetical protein